MVVPEDAPVPNCFLPPSFSCADHISVRLRTSLVLLKGIITSLTEIKDDVYLPGLIFNLNLLCNEYHCLFLYAFVISTIIIPQYTRVLNSDMVRIHLIFEYFLTV